MLQTGSPAFFARIRIFFRANLNQANMSAIKCSLVGLGHFRFPSFYLPTDLFARLSAFSFYPAQLDGLAKVGARHRHCCPQRERCNKWGTCVFWFSSGKAQSATKSLGAVAVLIMPTITIQAGYRLLNIFAAQYCRTGLTATLGAHDLGYSTVIT